MYQWIKVVFLGCWLCLLGACQTTEGKRSPSNPAGGERCLEKFDASRAQAMAFYSHGLLLQMEGNNREALGAFLSALQFDPQYDALYMQAALEYLRLGDRAAGLAVLERLRERRPRKAEPVLWSGLLCRLDGDEVAAERYFREAIALEPGLSDGYLELAALYLGRGENGAAVSLLERAVGRVRPEDRLGVLYLLGDVYVVTSTNQAQRRAGIDFLEGVKGRNNWQVVARLGDLYILDQQLTNGLACFQRAEQLRRGDLQLKAKVALVLAALGREEEALGVVEELAKLRPPNAQAFCYLGALYEKIGLTNKAIASFERAAAMDPPEAEPFLQLAALTMERDDGVAIEYLQTGLRLLPENRDLRVALGYAYFRAERYREAVEEFRLVGEGPAAFYFFYGAAWERLGDFEKAEEFLQRSVALDVGQGEALNYLAYIWAERGTNLVVAGEYVGRALALEPENAAYLDTAGWVLYKQGEYEKALGFLEKAAGLLADPVIAEHLEATLGKLGRSAGRPKSKFSESK